VQLTSALVPVHASVNKLLFDNINASDVLLQSNQLMVSQLQQDVDQLATENRKLAEHNAKQLLEIQRLQFMEVSSAKLSDELTQANQMVML